MGSMPCGGRIAVVRASVQMCGGLDPCSCQRDGTVGGSHISDRRDGPSPPHITLRGIAPDCTPLHAAHAPHRRSELPTFCRTCA